MADLVASVFGLFFGLFWLIWLLWMALIFAGLIFWVIMLIDVVKREFPKKDDKTLWVLVVVLTGAIGAIIYYFMVKRKGKIF